MHWRCSSWLLWGWCADCGVTSFGNRKSLSIAKNHPKPSQDFAEQIGPSIHDMKGFMRNSPPKVHPNFAQNLGREILGNTFSVLKSCDVPHPGPGTSSTRTSCKVPCLVALDREWPGCPAIWVRTSRDQKNSILGQCQRPP